MIIKQGIYDISKCRAYDYAGFWHKETRREISMCNKLKYYLQKKAEKFSKRYELKWFPFTFGVDEYASIEAISVCHPFFDYFNPEVGENIVIGRIKRMRGDIKKYIYEREEYDREIKEREDFRTGVTTYKIVKCKRVKKDEYGNPVIKRTIFFKPYDLKKRHPIIKHSDGSESGGELVYPYVYKLERYGDENHQYNNPREEYIES